MMMWSGSGRLHAKTAESALHKSMVVYYERGVGTAMGMTIVEAIKQVMRSKGKPMTAVEVYGAIMEAGLYTFNADNPGHKISFTDLRKQAETLRDQLKMNDFKVDPKQMDELNRQMEDFSKEFKADDFKLDQKQLDELKKQMEQFREDFNPADLQNDPI